MSLRPIVRDLIRNPGFAAVVIATLALGVAANAMILTVVNCVLLKPLRFRDADRLVRVYHDAPGLGIGTDDIGLSQATYLLFRATGLLEDLAIYTVDAANVSGGEEPQRVTSVAVSHSFFDTLGIPPLVGRTFNPADEEPGAPRVVLLAESLWRRNFGARPEIIGETIIKDAEPAEVVGVVPAIGFPEPQADIYEVMTLARAPGTLGLLGANSVGRLPPGTTAADVGEQLAARIAGLTEVFPDESAAPILARAGFTTRAVPLQRYMVGDVERTLWTLMGSAGFVLLIIGANLANVFLVRGEERARDTAVRAALGAGRRRLAADSLAEGALLGLLSGAVGLILAAVGVRALLLFRPRGLPRADEIGIDATVLASALLLALVAGLSFGLVAVLRHDATAMAAALRSGRGNTAVRAQVRLRSVLVTAQIALALVLLVGSGLMVRSHAALAAVDPGFDAGSLLTFHVGLSGNKYPGEEAPARFIQSCIDALGDMPGVVSVAAVNGLPLTDGFSRQGYHIEDHPLAAGALPPFHAFKYASADYFETMGIPLISGRTFMRADHEERRDVVIVNEAFARLYWPDQDPIGRRLQQGGSTPPRPEDWYRVVGVVGDVRGNGPPGSGGAARLAAEPVATLYFPLVAILREDVDGQRTSPSWSVRDPTFVVRTSVDPAALVAPIRRRVLEMDPDLPLADVLTVDEMVGAATAQQSFTMVALLAGSAGALLIGAVGVYGVIACTVARQTREIGVRMALGARPEEIGGMFLRRSLTMALAGIAVGVAAAWYLTRFTGSLLYGVDPLDFPTFVVVVVTMLVVVLLAAYLPARRALHVDPAETLRLQ